MSEPATELPGHVAIIMDGNGRWAQQRGLRRTEGHMAGAESARKIVQACVDLGISVLTLYAFSTENWNRPRAEVRFLMSQLRKFLKERRQEFVDTRVRLEVIGVPDELPKGVQTELQATMDATRENDAMTLVLALNYGARREITDAARAIARKVQAGELSPEDIDQDTVQQHLYKGALPDPDLLIRTGGEQRVSNFLLWQISYTEMYVTDTLWPDFDEAALAHALRDYAGRERRFGKVGKGSGTRR